MFVLRACLCHTKWLHGWGSQSQSWSKSYPVVFHPIVEQLTVSIPLDSFSSQPWAERARKVRKLCNLKPVTDRHTTTNTNSDQGPTSARHACIITSLTLRRSAINVPQNTPSRYKITNPKRDHLSKSGHVFDPSKDDRIQLVCQQLSDSLHSLILYHIVDVASCDTLAVL